MSEKDKEIDFYQIYNTTPKIGPIPRPQILPLALSLVLSLIFVGIFGGNTTAWFFLWLWIYSAWLVASGGRTHDFTDTFIANPNVTNGYTRWVNPNNKKAFKIKKKKLKTIRHKTLKGKQDYTAFQNFSDLDSILEINIDRQRYAVFLCFDRNNLAYAFIPFKVEELHPESTSFEKIAYIKGISSGGKNFPLYENLKYVLSISSTYSDRYLELNELAELSHPTIATLNYNEIATTRAATKAGIRQEWNLLAIGSWSEKESKKAILDTWWERISKTLEDFIDFMSGTSTDRKENRYSNLAAAIDYSGYHHWKTFLESSSGLKVSSLSGEEAWQWLSSQFIDPADPIDPDTRSYAPRPIDVKVSQIEHQLKPSIKTISPRPKDLITTILEQTELDTRYGYEAVKIGSRWMGVLTLATTNFSEEADLVSEQLDWLWEILSKPFVRDTTLSIQIEKADKFEIEDRLVKLGKQSFQEQKVASWQEGNIDVEAIDYQSESRQARRRLRSTDLLIVGLTIFIFRGTRAQLNRDLDRLKKEVKQVNMIRENKACFRAWMEFLPINKWKQLVSTNVLSERRTIVDNKSLPLLLPLVQPLKLHSNGIEYLSNPGGKPIYFDPFLKSTHLLIVGKTGTGKDVKLFDFVRLAVSRSIKVVGMDLTSQSESPYKLPLELLGEKAAYVNLLESHYNIMQPPNFDNIPAQSRKTRSKIWQTNLIDSLYIFGKGRMNDPVLCERIESLTIKLVKVFLSDPTILRRYKLAMRDGPNTEAWQDIPILKDLLWFCTRAKLGLEENDSITKQALTQIKTQIQSKLDDPNIGSAIGSPSTIPVDPLVTLFAFSGLNSATNSAIMTQVAHMACLNAALSNPKSFVFINEFDSLAKREGFSRLAGEYFARKRKEGCSVAIVATALESIKKCSAGAEIITNFDTIFVGKVTNQLEVYAQELKIPLEVLKENATQPDLEGHKFLVRPWLIWKDGIVRKTFRISPPLQVGMLANNTNEKLLREEILKQYPHTLEGRLSGIKEFAQTLSASG